MNKNNINKKIHFTMILAVIFFGSSSNPASAENIQATPVTQEENVSSDSSDKNETTSAIYPIANINSVGTSLQGVMIYTKEHALKHTGSYTKISYDTIVENGVIIETFQGSNVRIPKDTDLESNSFVISGHGINKYRAGYWLNKHAKSGSEVKLHLDDPANQYIEIITSSSIGTPPKPIDPEIPGDDKTDNPDIENPDNVDIENPIDVPSDEILDSLPPVSNPGDGPVLDQGNEEISSEVDITASPGDKVEIVLDLDRRGQEVRLFSESLGFSMEKSVYVDNDNMVKFALPNYFPAGTHRINVVDEYDILVGWADILVVISDEEADAIDKEIVPVSSKKEFEADRYVDLSIEKSSNIEDGLAETGASKMFLATGSLLFMSLGGVFFFVKNKKK